MTFAHAGHDHMVEETNTTFVDPVLIGLILVVALVVVGIVFYDKKKRRSTTSKQAPKK